MHQMTTEAIQKLQKETGHVLIAEDFDLISELDDCAQRVSGIFKDDERFLRFPVQAGNILLYPITIAKSELLVDCDLSEREFVYLLTLPNEAPCLPPAKELRKEANRLYKTMTCTPKELGDAIERVASLSGSCDSGSGSGGSDWPLVIDLLCSEFGSSPEYWIYHESITLIQSLINRIIERRQQQNEATEKGKAPVQSAKIKSLHDFRQKFNALREIWSKDNG